jgi:hypothetical protein
MFVFCPDADDQTAVVQLYTPDDRPIIHVTEIAVRGDPHTATRRAIVRAAAMLGNMDS